MKNKRFRPKYKCDGCQCVFEKKEKHGCLDREVWIKLRQALPKKRGEKMKNCTTHEPCSYRVLEPGSIGCGCKYIGYCDFQLPRDSRMQPLTPFPNYCHLPLSKCQGHTIY